VALPSCRCAPALPAETMADTGEGVPPETAAQKKAQIAAILSNRAARVEGDGEGAASCPEPEAAPRVRVRTAMFVIGKDGKPLSGMQLRAWEAKRAKQAAAAPLPPALRVSEQPPPNGSSSEGGDTTAAADEAAADGADDDGYTGGGSVELTSEAAAMVQVLRDRLRTADATSLEEEVEDDASGDEEEAEAEPEAEPVVEPVAEVAAEAETATDPVPAELEGVYTSAMEVQYHGKGKFIPAEVTLSQQDVSLRVSFEEKGVKKHVEFGVDGRAWRFFPPKKARKGRPLCMRVEGGVRAFSRLFHRQLPAYPPCANRSRRSWPWRTRVGEQGQVRPSQGTRRWL
jgi:hypothetical protein